jgi:hypothetical protein
MSGVDQANHLMRRYASNSQSEPRGRWWMEYFNPRRQKMKLIKKNYCFTDILSEEEQSLKSVIKLTGIKPQTAVSANQSCRDRSRTEKLAVCIDITVSNHSQSFQFRGRSHNIQRIGTHNSLTACRVPYHSESESCPYPRLLAADPR